MSADSDKQQAAVNVLESLGYTWDFPGAWRQPKLPQHAGSDALRLERELREEISRRRSLNGPLVL